jgi:hypothetical protein
MRMLKKRRFGTHPDGIFNDFGYFSAKILLFSVNIFSALKCLELQIFNEITGFHKTVRRICEITGKFQRFLCPKLFIYKEIYRHSRRKKVEIVLEKVEIVLFIYQKLIANFASQKFRI